MNFPKEAGRVLPRVAGAAIMALSLNAMLLRATHASEIPSQPSVNYSKDLGRNATEINGGKEPSVNADADRFIKNAELIREAADPNMGLTEAPRTVTVSLANSVDVKITGIEIPIPDR